MRNWEANLGGVTMQYWQGMGRFHEAELGGEFGAAMGQNWEVQQVRIDRMVGQYGQANWELQRFTIGRCKYAILARWQFRFGR
jgi:hypothetical protein